MPSGLARLLGLQLVVGVALAATGGVALAEAR
jgi:hypothetical protein